jgi:hypothetical protein
MMIIVVLLVTFGGSYSMLAVEAENIPIWLDSDIQTPSLSN